ncbi:MAG: nicotinate-nucleotide--dimethylbenzimidazole phosphoribosyltransferase [Paramuribaculum sp.]|nr:nicotinate-nucleotide--dimethylbenzimidazole phosphoribosyltransferase [Paramuribaculum sp.]
MRKFNISPLDRSLEPALRNRIDNLTKPKGSLGRLEDLALQIGLIQKSLKPVFRSPANILFAADHGIIAEGVSVSPKEVTWQQLAHFSKGGAGINFLCDQHGFRLVLVDAGVDYDIPQGHGIIDMKMGRGTGNFLHEPAMTTDQWHEALDRGARVVEMVHADGCNVVSFGEMGSGNTSPSAIWMHILTEIPLSLCVGAGAGLNNSGVGHKLRVLSQAIDNCPLDKADIQGRLAYFGGFEMAMAVGGMLRAAELGMLIIVDGFIMTACIAAAMSIDPAVKEYAVFGHCGDEAGHKLMLEALGARPLLHLSLRLGEGSGAVCAFPVIDSAARMITEMDTFADVDVTKYF